MAVCSRLLYFQDNAGACNDRHLRQIIYDSNQSYKPTFRQRLFAEASSIPATKVNIFRSKFKKKKNFGRPPGIRKEKMGVVMIDRLIGHSGSP